MNKAAHYLLGAVLFTAACSGERELVSEIKPANDHEAVTAPMPAGELDAYMVETVLPRFDRSVRGSMGSGPHAYFGGSKWVTARRTVVATVELDFTKRPEHADLTREEILALYDERRDAMRAERSSMIAGLKAALVIKICEAQSEPAAQKELNFMKANGITIELGFSEKNGLMDPVSFSVTPADLQHCY